VDLVFAALMEAPRVGHTNHTTRLAQAGKWPRSQHYAMLRAVCVDRLQHDEMPQLETRLGAWAAWCLGRVAGWCEVAIAKARTQDATRVSLRAAVLAALAPVETDRLIHTFVVACFDFVGACLTRVPSKQHRELAMEAAGHTGMNGDTTRRHLNDIVRRCAREALSKMDALLIARMKLPPRDASITAPVADVLPDPKEPDVTDDDCCRPLTDEEVQELWDKLDQNGKLASPWLTGRIEVRRARAPREDHKPPMPRPPDARYLDRDAAATIGRLIDAAAGGSALLSVNNGVLQGRIPVAPELVGDGEVVDVQLVPPIGVMAEDVTVWGRAEYVDGAARVIVDVPIACADGPIVASIRVQPRWRPPANLAEQSMLEIASAALDAFPMRADEWEGIVVTEESALHRIRRWFRALLGLDTVLVVDDRLATGLGLGAGDAAGVIELDPGSPVHFEIRDRSTQPSRGLVEERRRVVAWDVGLHGETFAVDRILNVDVTAGQRLAWTVHAAPARGDHLVVIVSGNDQEIAEAVEVMAHELGEAELFAALEILAEADARVWRYRTA
jgi:hypothetical protein